MIDANNFLYSILNKYRPIDISKSELQLSILKEVLTTWAQDCYLGIFESGSRAKQTAISLGSDIDFLISLKNECNNNNGGLQACYQSLYSFLKPIYSNVRKQNVSVRIYLSGINVDITPGKRLEGSSSRHSLFVSKSSTWVLSDIQQHIQDISYSGLTSEIKIFKIWRELYKLDFPSIYLEYLLRDKILVNKSKDIKNLAENVWYALIELSREQGNPLFSRLVDPANSNNILSNLLTEFEKNQIVLVARECVSLRYLDRILW